MQVLKYNLNINCCIYFIESAVIFIAWLGIICCCIWLINLVAVLIYVSFFASFEELNIFVRHPVFVNGSDSNDIENVTISSPVHVESPKIGRIFPIVLLLIIIAITCYFLWVSKSLLFGVQERKSQYMKPYLILSSFMFLIECINILRGDLITIPGVTISNTTQIKSYFIYLLTFHYL